MADKTTGNRYLYTSFANSGRISGMGMSYDDYSEDSGFQGYARPFERVRFPHDNIKPEELNDECVIVQKGNKDGK